MPSQTRHRHCDPNARASAPDPDPIEDPDSDSADADTSPAFIVLHTTLHMQWRPITAEARRNLAQADRHLAHLAGHYGPATQDRDALNQWLDDCIGFMTNYLRQDLYRTVFAAHRRHGLHRPTWYKTTWR